MPEVIKFLLLCSFVVSVFATFALPESDPELDPVIASKILMGRSSPSIIPPLAPANPDANSAPRIAPSSNTNSLEEHRNVNKSYIYSPLHVAHCRAACLEKFTNKARVAATTFRDRLASEQARRIPNLLRFRRKRDTKYYTQLFSNCLKLSPGCQSCWTRCQVIPYNRTEIAQPVTINATGHLSPHSANSSFELQENVVKRSEDKRKAQNVISSDSILSPSTLSASPSLLRLYLVSLMRDKSIVIAKLQWNQVDEESKGQKYLVTWELTEGGLKGQLVTESTSVSLSLWANSSYKITVAILSINFHSDEEQPPFEENIFVRSSPLIVDTDLALHPDSELLPRNLNEEENEAEDIWEENGPNSKSFSQVVLVVLASMALVVLVLALFAMSMIKLKILGTGQSYMGSKIDNESLSASNCDGVSFPEKDLLTNSQVVEEYSPIFVLPVHTKNAAESLYTRNDKSLQECWYYRT